MFDYIIAHPLYIPLIILNIYIIYEVIKTVTGKDQGNNDDDQDGGITNTKDPVLDLPPGVGLPSEESVLNV